MRSVIGGLAGAVFCSMLLCGRANAARYTIRWIQIHDPIVVADRAAKDFARRVEKASGGEIRVEVITKPQHEKRSGRMMSNVGVMREIDAGEGEMCQIYTHSLAKYAQKLLTLGMPYLFRDYGHAERVLEGPLGRGLLGRLPAPANLRALGVTYSGGFGIISSKGLEVRRPEQLKGLRMLTSRFPFSNAIMMSLGIEPVVAAPDAYVPLAQKGLVDVAETTMVCFDMYGDRRASDTISDTGHFLLTSMIVVNEKFFAGLPAEYRALIEREALETARTERQASIAANLNSRRRMIAKGVKILELTAAEKKGFEAALGAQYEFMRLDAAFIRKIRAVGL